MALVAREMPERKNSKSKMLLSTAGRGGFLRRQSSIKKEISLRLQMNHFKGEVQVRKKERKELFATRSTPEKI